ncbi:hypothetical protein [Chondromyces apiculatus]|uniref:hypothetical protein n=1 Tax=Chondromyces apiculatus TaxID=51 RepID=UPI0012DBD993|nr:hypothetical protein [Chondromyces apiculatus]
MRWRRGAVVAGQPEVLGTLGVLRLPGEPVEVAFNLGIEAMQLAVVAVTIKRWSRRGE